jgi:hypothetical protein
VNLLRLRIAASRKIPEIRTVTSRRGRRSSASVGEDTVTLVSVGDLGGSVG